MKLKIKAFLFFAFIGGIIGASGYYFNSSLVLNTSNNIDGKLQLEREKLLSKIQLEKIELYKSISSLLIASEVLSMNWAAESYKSSAEFYNLARLRASVARGQPPRQYGQLLEGIDPLVEIVKAYEEYLVTEIKTKVKIQRHIASYKRNLIVAKGISNSDQEFLKDQHKMLDDIMLSNDKLTSVTNEIKKWVLPIDEKVKKIVLKVPGSANYYKSYYDLLRVDEFSENDVLQSIVRDGGVESGLMQLVLNEARSRMLEAKLDLYMAARNYELAIMNYQGLLDISLSRWDVFTSFLKRGGHLGVPQGYIGPIREAMTKRVKRSEPYFQIGTAADDFHLAIDQYNATSKLVKLTFEKQHPMLRRILSEENTGISFNQGALAVNVKSLDKVINHAKTKLDGQEKNIYRMEQKYNSFLREYAARL